MYALRRTLDYTGYLSDDARDLVGRRVRLFCGLALVALAVLAGLALATWSVKDPSLSNATSAPVRNLLGLPGAITADLLMQLVGTAALAVVLPVAVWGWRLMSQRGLDRERLRMALWLVGIVFAAAFASCLPTTARWPLPTGLGGVIGDAVLRLPANLLGGPLSGASRLVMAVLTGAIALFALAGAGRLRARDVGNDMAEGMDEPEPAPGLFERIFVSLGLVYHGFLTLKAWFGRAWRAGDDAAPRRERGGRVEPRLGAAASGAADADDEEDEEEEDDEEEPVRRARKPARPRPTGRGGKFELPSVGLLAAPKANERYAPNQKAIDETATALGGVLQDFGVRGEIINAHPGPVVTLYELEPAPGVKSSRVIGLADDIARSMSALAARVAVVAGRNAIGIELPNPKREKVYLRELLVAEDYKDSSAKLPLCLGKTIGGDPVIVDLARMPHLLIAGTTGSGKSVAINTMILSLLYCLKPDQCRLIMVDPKMLELSVYDSIPHLLTPVVTDPKKAVVALKWAVREMEDRYKKMAKLGVRNIDGYNTRLAEARQKGETLTRTVHTGYDKESGEAIYE